MGLFDCAGRHASALIPDVRGTAARATLGFCGLARALQAGRSR